jgi:hypothetical protein
MNTHEPKGLPDFGTVVDIIPEFDRVFTITTAAAWVTLEQEKVEHR